MAGGNESEMIGLSFSSAKPRRTCGGAALKVWLERAMLAVRNQSTGAP